MKQEVILVLDCGATNVRAIAVNRQGKIVARASTPNASDIAMENNTWHQWSLDPFCNALLIAVGKSIVN
ncbi:L-fuculokinase [Shigella sonnei]|nr:L-fuculokinase [Shigella sonnei]